MCVCVCLSEVRLYVCVVVRMSQQGLSVCVQVVEIWQHHLSTLVDRQLSEAADSNSLLLNQELTSAQALASQPPPLGTVAGLCSASCLSCRRDTARICC